MTVDRRTLETLHVEVGADRLDAGWGRVEHTRRRRAVRRQAAGAGVVALTAVALIGLVVAPRASAPQGEPLRATGAVAIVDALEAGASLTFDDGSRITPSEGATLTPVVNDGRRFGVALERGNARFEVTPGGPRRWIVEAGLATVEVVGTVFVVERDDDAVTVRVERGEVRVRGPGLENGEARVRAGESVTVPPPRAEGARPVEEREASAPPEPASSEAAAPEASSPEASSEAVPEPRAPGAHRPPPSEDVPSPMVEPASEDLLAQADAARREGDPDRAMALLGRVVNRSGDPHAPIAALSRGRLALELDRPRDAVDDLRRAAAVGRPALAETARARLVEALARSGDHDGARAAADDYLARYPEGPWRAMVARWADR